MTTAIVVARGGSKRLPRKALLPFGGGSLISHKVQTLQHCRLVDRIVVGSDSDEILQEAARVGADTVRRDDYHCDESRCSANEMIHDMVSKVDGDTIVWAHPTNPLVRAESYDAAIRAHLDFKGCDSLASVTVIRRHAWWLGKPLNFNPNAKHHQLAADLQPILHQDGAIFIQPREQMIRNRYFYGDKPLFFPLQITEGWDIDTRADYEVAISCYDSQPHKRETDASSRSTCSITDTRRGVHLAE